MGVAGSSGFEARARKSLASIEEHRDTLVKNQEEKMGHASRVLAHAKALHKAGDRNGTISNLKRYRQMTSQVKTIGGIISTLDAHANAIETKLITNSTMKIMKQTSQVFSKNQPSMDDIDDFMLDSEQSLGDADDMSRAFSALDEVSDDELLALLGGNLDSPVAAAQDAQAAPSSVHVSIYDDDVVIKEMEAAIISGRLPSVPSAEIVAPPPSYSPHPPRALLSY